MDYGNILSRAWKITWNNKILWIFGFLASLSSGGGGANAGGRVSGPGGPNNPFGPQAQRDLERWLQRPEVISTVLAVGCVLLLIGIALFLLSIIGRGGLIGGIRLADDRLEAGSKVSFGEAWGVGARYFWRLLGLTLILAVPALVFALIAAALVLLTSGLGALCVLPLVCLFIIVIVPFSVVVALAQFGVVLEDKGVIDSLRRGWEVLKTNIANILILGLITVVIGFILSLVLLVPLLLIVFPAVFAYVLNPQNPNVPVLIGAGVGFLCYVPILLAIQSVLTTWIYSAWTLAYRQFTGNMPSPALPPQPSAPDSLQPA